MKFKPKHGLSHTPEHQAWSSMIRRCYKSNCHNYSAYGGRGIKVCDEWLDSNFGFQRFLAHIGPRPSPEHSLDRIDTNGNYDPGNVRWATVNVQASNKRNNSLVTYKGVTKHIAEWARDTGLDASLISYRIRAGWSADDAIGTPVPVDGSPGLRPGDSFENRSRKRSYLGKITAFGQTLLPCEWSERTGIKAQTIIARVKKFGMTPEQALTTPVGRTYPGKRAASR